MMEALTGESDWVPPVVEVKVKDIEERQPRPHLKAVTQSMTEIMRESSCEQGLYPRVAILLVEMISMYKDLVPSGIRMKVHPQIRFKGTDKCADYAAVVISAVGFKTTMLQGATPLHIT